MIDKKNKYMAINLNQNQNPADRVMDMLALLLREKRDEKNLPHLQVFMCFIFLLVKHEFSFLCFCPNR